MSISTHTETVVDRWFAATRLAESDHFIAVYDAFPVSPGHALVVSKRDVGDALGLTAEEYADMHAIVAETVAVLHCEHAPDGFSVGANCGAAAGQTVMRFHLHIIPRFDGDVADPRGGVRNVNRAGQVVDPALRTMSHCAAACPEQGARLAELQRRNRMHAERADLAEMALAEASRALVTAGVVLTEADGDGSDDV